MAYSKIAKRTPKEQKAFDHWFRNPVRAVQDWFGTTPDDWQAHALEKAFSGSRVAIKSAHGVGKTAFDAWCGWIFLNCLVDSRVVATAPTQAQLQDALFAEYSLWHSKMPEKMQSEWVISATHIRHKSNPNVWFAVARTSNKPANLQGFHNKYLFIQADEASGIQENVFEVMEGALSEADDDADSDRIAKLVMNGNPNFTAGEMFNAFGKNKSLYHRITVTGDPEFMPSLNVAQGTEHPDHGVMFYSKRVRAKYVANMASKYGRDSAIFDVRVRGVFPRFSDECVISWQHAMNATMLELPPFDAVADGVSLVVDPARGGAAETVIGFARKGMLTKIEGHKTKTTTEVVALIQEAVLRIVKAGSRLIEIIIDEPGVGGGVIDQARMAGLPVTAYNGSYPMIEGQDPEEDRRLFANRRARDWWNVRLLLERGNYPIPNDETLIAQLTSVRYGYNKQEKILIESKEDLKNRLGKDASPDRADVLVMACAPRYQPAQVAGIIRPGDIFVGGDRETLDF